MREMVHMKKNLKEYQAVIFDMDGTLYSQPKLRFYMIRDLAIYYVFHPTKIKEIFILKKYRSIREHWENHASESMDSSSSIEEEQFEYVATKMHTSPEQVKQITSYWIQKHPLDLLPKCKDMVLISIINLLRFHAITIAIYSDYPAKDKLQALNIHVDHIFCSSDNDINCMKPSQDAMNTILGKLHADSQNVLMIGDRYSKDGIAAKNLGMDFLILKKFIPNRANLYYSLLKYL